VVLLLVRTLTFLVAAAVGLLVTSLLVPGFSLRPVGFVTTVVVFTVVQSVLAPLVARLAKRHAAAFLGGVGILTTFVALLVAEQFTSGLQITGTAAWLGATFLVWLFTALATLLLPRVLFRETVAKRQAGRRA